MGPRCTLAAGVAADHRHPRCRPGGGALGDRDRARELWRVHRRTVTGARLRGQALASGQESHGAPPGYYPRAGHASTFWPERRSSCCRRSAMPSRRGPIPRPGSSSPWTCRWPWVMFERQCPGKLLLHYILPWWPRAGDAAKASCGSWIVPALTLLRGWRIAGPLSNSALGAAALDFRAAIVLPDRYGVVARCWRGGHHGRYCVDLCAGGARAGSATARCLRRSWPSR